MTITLFKITPTPPGSIKLLPGEEGKLSFTVESLAAPDQVQAIMLQALLVGEGGKGKEVDWLIAGPRRTLSMTGGQVETITITARPKATSPRGEHRIKLVIADRDRPNDVYADSPAVICEVSGPIERPRPQRDLPWWLIPAALGGLVLLIGGALLVWKLTRPAGPPGLGEPCSRDAARPCDEGLLCVPGVKRCLLAGGADCEPAKAAQCASGECKSESEVCAIPLGGACADPLLCPTNSTCDPATKTCLAPDAVPEVRCDPAARFGAPTLVPGFTSGSWFSPRLSDDELTMYLSGRGIGGTDEDLWVTSRVSRQASFGAPVKLAISSGAPDNFPTVSADGRTIVFDSTRSGPRRLWVATRASVLGELANPELMSGVGAPVAHDADVDPFLTADGHELWFASNRSPNQGDIDLWRATRSGTGFANPVPEPNLSSNASDGVPVLSHDRLTIYFQSARAGIGAMGSYDVWRSRRSTVSDGFPAPTPVTELNSTGIDWPGWLSPDGCRLYLTSDRNGTLTIYLAERQP